jgi:hypothetical protein
MLIFKAVLRKAGPQLLLINKKRGRVMRRIELDLAISHRIRVRVRVRVRDLATA